MLHDLDRERNLHNRRTASQDSVKRWPTKFISILASNKRGIHREEKCPSPDIEGIFAQQFYTFSIVSNGATKQNEDRF